jgi:CheY-like chemotaxis protein
MPGRSILICDDEVELAAEIGEYLDALGWMVRVTYSGPAAMEMLNSGDRVDCLLTDLRIADFDGADLIAYARGLPLDRQPTVIGVITGHLEEWIEASDIGADALHIKPIDPDRLAEHLATLIDRAVSDGIDAGR